MNSTFKIYVNPIPIMNLRQIEADSKWLIITRPFLWLCSSMKRQINIGPLQMMLTIPYGWHGISVANNFKQNTNSRKIVDFRPNCHKICLDFQCFLFWISDTMLFLIFAVIHKGVSGIKCNYPLGLRKAVKWY